LIKNIYIPTKLISFLSSKEISKNQDKNSARRYLPEISFVPRRDNGPLGVKRSGKTRKEDNRKEEAWDFSN